MARCEDFPCCGHEAGCCPDFDDAGRQLNMKCVCGATVPLSSRSSLCPSCLAHDPDDPYAYEDERWEEDEDEDEDWEEDEYDGQPDEAQEWHDFDPDC